MLISSISDFVKIIPTAEGTEFSAIEPFLVQAENQIKSWHTGPDLFQAVSQMQITDQAKIQLRILVAYTAYRDAIPFADLIQTNNGFAVVNNTNQSPASKERVVRLISWVEQIIDKSEDLLVQIVYSTSELLQEWKKWHLFNDKVCCFFVTGSDYAYHVKVSGNKRQALVNDMGKLRAWQVNVIAPVISKVYLDQLISELRNNNFTDGSGNIVNYCKLILSRLSEGNQDETVKLLNAVSNILDTNLDTYSAYASSDEYKLKTGTKYQNTEESPAFFFGM